MTRRLTRHDFNRAYVRGCPRHDIPTADAPAPASPPLSALLPPAPPPMETLAESWRAKGG